MVIGNNDHQRPALTEGRDETPLPFYVVLQPSPGQNYLHDIVAVN